MPDLQEQAITPNRSTKVTFDVDETVLYDEAWSIVRNGPDVSKLAASKTADDVNHTNVRFWPSSGAWTLTPVQEDIANLHEYTDVLSLIIPAGSFRLINTLSSAAQIATINQWRQASDLPGQAFNAAISASGDQFMVKSVPAGNSWNASLPSGTTVPPGTTVDVPLDRCGESAAPFPADQGYCLRWSATGTAQSYNGYLWSFYFGQYALSMKGNGQAALYENCHDHSGTLKWSKRASFQYSRPSGIGGASQSLCLWPHVGPSGERYIAFFGNMLELGNFVAAETKTKQQNIQGGEFLYRVSGLIRGTDRDESPGHVTRADLCRFDIRRDLRIKLQISKLGFATSGTLIDIPELLPIQTAGGPINVGLNATIPTATTLTTTLKDALTLAPFNPVTDTQPYVTFNFTSDGSNTPILWGYAMVREPITQNISPGQFTGGVLTSFSSTGAEGDPSHESAQLAISDIKNELSKLRNRGQSTVKVEVTETPSGGSPRTTVLIRGSAYRPHSKRMGKTGRHDGGGGLGPATVYPDPAFCDYTVPVLGMWARLYERVQEPTTLTKYALDNLPPPFGHNVPFGFPFTAVPWKVTDAIRDLLYTCGFPASQVNIINLNDRLWTGHTSQVAEYEINPTTNLAEVIVRMCRNYLGAYLYYDPNAGTIGQWRILRPPRPVAGVYTPIWNFTTVPPAGKVPHLPQSYPSSTSFAVEGERYVVPPDYNIVRVMTPWGNSKDHTRIENTMYNPKSFNVPGFTNVLDTNDPDYFGRPRPLLHIDPTLASSDAQETQRAVDWTCRRLFDFLCHAQTIQPFTAPLPIFADPDNAGKWRMPRFQDPVTFNGATYILRSVNMAWRDDKQQMAEYEAVQPTVF